MQPRVSTTTRRGGRWAFTIVELMVVLVVLALLSAIAIPRVASIDRRKAQVALDQLHDVLSVFAYRDSLGSQRIGFGPDEETGAIGVFIKEFDPTDPDSSDEWLPDRFVDPVFLPSGMELVDVRLDDRSLPLDDWFIASMPGGDRPRIELRVASEQLSASLLLEPYMIAPVVFEDNRPPPPVRLPVDLDSVGMDRGTW